MPQAMEFDFGKFQTVNEKKCCQPTLTHSLIHQFETIPNSKKLQMTTEMWLLKDFEIQTA